MNSLNSILVEGHVVGEVETYGGGCRFRIESQRFYYKGDAEIEREASTFEVRVMNPRLAETCREKLRNGRMVRVVGRLYEDKATTWDVEGRAVGLVVVVVEHIEFRPTWPTKGVD